MTLLSQNVNISHELIASKAGMSARTVYRHFPDRASLMLAVWQRLREAIQFEFPATEDEIVPRAQSVFSALTQTKL